jgi:hypothetical protein
MRAIAEYSGAYTNTGVTHVPGRDMNWARYLVLGALLTITGLAGAQTAPPARQPGGTDPSAGTVNTVPQRQLLRILTPVASQKLNKNAIRVRFELVNPGAYTGTPNFFVQLDGDEPVRTSTTGQNFTGLAPGTHSVTVTLVGANDTPVPGGRAEGQFLVAPQNGAPASQRTDKPKADNRNLQLGGYNFQKPNPTKETADAGLPKANSPLPLLSVIGFGILVGGIVSAMKTRS